VVISAEIPAADALGAPGLSRPQRRAPLSAATADHLTASEIRREDPLRPQIDLIAECDR
jgi:hypothetical protein